MKIKKPIYLDYQASTPVRAAVMSEMLPFFTESFANPHSANHAAGWEAESAIHAAQSKISSIIGCDPDEIIFTSGATEANNLAILGLRRALHKDGRSKIVTTAIEHKSVLDPCRIASEEYGAVIHKCEVNKSGYLDNDKFFDVLDEDVLLTSVSAVNGEIGTLQDISRIYDAASRYGIIVHVDAAQMPIASDMTGTAQFADMMSLSGHKIYGPKGIGCLYVRRSVQSLILPLFFGGAQQNGMRSGTLPVPLCVGMGVAAELLSCRPSAIDELRAKTQMLWEGILTLGFDVALNGPSMEGRHPGNLNIRFTGFEAEEILGVLQPQLAASTGSACTSGTPEVSYVLRATGLTEEEARSSIRFSVGHETTEDEISRAVDLIGEALRRLDNSGMREIA